MSKVGRRFNFESWELFIISILAARTTILGAVVLNNNYTVHLL